ncbi:MAG: endonuclease/exonuclease/phosphatase family protein [Clostridia bacterium]|nr:endonuclease/exonuclease/phosphatase family protein [Clostridia bacterium]
MMRSGKILFKLIAALLAMMMALSFVACTDTGDGEESENSESQSEIDTTVGEVPLTLFANGETNFKIIYPENCDDAIFSAVRMLATAFEECGGTEIEYEGDFIPRDEEPDSEAYEILIGDTNRPETQAQKEYLKDQTGYTIVREGNKLVLFGYTVTATVNAVNYFARNYIREPANAAEGGQLTELLFWAEDEYVYQKEFAIKTLTINGTELSDCKIVVPATGYVEKYIAQVFCRHLLRYYGMAPEIVTDAEAAGECEFRIGKTNRTTITAEDGKYNIAIGDSGLDAVANSFMGYADILTALQRKVITYTRSELALKTGDTWTGDASSPTLDQSGDLTVIFHNVLGYQSEYVVANRAELALQIYLEYAPEVICLEEFGAKYRSGAATLISGLRNSGYVEVSDSGNGVGNPIFYDSKKLDLIEKGYKASRNGDKGTTWVVLEVKSSGKRFAVTNSHFAANSNANNDAELGNEYRKADAATAVSVYDAIKAKYADIPIFVGGDFNSALGSDPYKVLTDGGLTSVRDTAVKTTEYSAQNGHPDYNKDYGYYELSSFKFNAGENAIDHIMTGGNMTGVTVLEYGLSNDKVSCTLSDHLPQLLSVKLS